MDAGRVLALLVTTRPGAVLAERFHGRLFEAERGDVRAAVAGTGRRAAEGGGEAVGRWKNAAVVSRVEGDLLLHAVGTGEHDELSLSRALRCLAAALRDGPGRGKPLTEGAALEGYGGVIMALDGVAYEGVLEAGAPGGEARAARVRGE